MATHNFDRGGQPNGDLTVSIGTFYGDEYVTIELSDGDSEAHLTAATARRLAADLLAHAAEIEDRAGSDEAVT